MLTILLVDSVRKALKGHIIPVMNSQDVDYNQRRETDGHTWAKSSIANALHDQSLSMNVRGDFWANISICNEA